MGRLSDAGNLHPAPAYLLRSEPTSLLSTFDMDTWRPCITIDPERCGNRPCIRGMRIRVIDVLDLLAAGLSREEVLEEMPDLPS
jgi:uncharacterized protein (DUF433 family)